MLNFKENTYHAWVFSLAVQWEKGWVSGKQGAYVGTGSEELVPL